MSSRKNLIIYKLVAIFVIIVFLCGLEMIPRRGFFGLGWLPVTYYLITIICGAITGIAFGEKYLIPAVVGFIIGGVCALFAISCAYGYPLLMIVLISSVGLLPGMCVYYLLKYYQDRILPPSKDVSTSQAASPRETDALDSQNQSFPVKNIRKGQIIFDCPACGALGSVGSIEEEIEITPLDKLFRIISLWRARELPLIIFVLVLHLIGDLLSLFIKPIRFRDTLIQCDDCKNKFHSLLPMDEMKGKSPMELAPYIAYHSSLIARLFATFGMLLFFVPLVGLTLSILGLYKSRGTRDWARCTCLCGLILGGTTTFLFAIIYLFDYFRIK